MEAKPTRVMNEEDGLTGLLLLLLRFVSISIMLSTLVVSSRSKYLILLLEFGCRIVVCVQ